MGTAVEGRVSSVEGQVVTGRDSRQSTAGSGWSTVDNKAYMTEYGLIADRNTNH